MSVFYYTFIFPRSGLQTILFGFTTRSVSHARKLVPSNFNLVGNKFLSSSFIYLDSKSIYLHITDPEDCTTWYTCRKGISSRFSCAPGLAFDEEDRVCKWEDQVKSCKEKMKEADENEIFTCPKSRTAGVYSKHAHPEDCRQGSSTYYGIT